MSLGQTLRNLRRDLNHLSHWQQAGDQQLAQRLPLYQLHRDVVSGAVLSEFVDGNDIGVVEGRRRARFLLESVQLVAVCGECGSRQELYRDRALKSRVPRSVDFAHTARSQWSNNFKWTEPAAWSEGHNWPLLYPRVSLFHTYSPHL